MDTIKVLIIFANPIDSSRLRLDIEDRVIDDVVRQLQGHRNVQFVR